MLAALVFSTATSLCGFPAQWDSSGGPSEVMTLLVDPVFRFSLPLRSWMRSLSTGSKFISYLTLTLMRTRSSRNRPESWRWERDTLLMSAVKMSTRPFACLGTANPVSPGSIWESPDPHLFFPGQYSLCCDWLQPADRGEGKEDPWSSLPLGSGWSGEPRAQWLPQATHHACVSVADDKLRNISAKLCCLPVCEESTACLFVAGPTCKTSRRSLRICIMRTSAQRDLRGRAGKTRRLSLKQLMGSSMSEWVLFCTSQVCGWRCVG